MKKVLIWATSIILFIELLDTTILYSCVVPIAKNFGVSPESMSLPIITYIIGTCIFIPVAAWLSHKYNKINIIITTLLIFALFSLLCGIAPDIYTFSVFRFFQGVAISISATIAIIALLLACPSNEIVKTIGAINIPALIGTALGPFIGAIFSYYISWRLSFFINVPICLSIVMAIAGFRSKVEFSSNQLNVKPLDYIGIILLSSSLIMVSTGFEQLSHSLNLKYFLVTLGGIIIGLCYLFIWKLRQKPINKMKIDSVLDLNIFKNRDFLFGAVVNVISRSAMCGLPILISIILQQWFDFSIIKAGAYLAIIAGAGIVAKFLSPLITQIGIHRSVLLSTILTAMSILILSQLELLLIHDYLWQACFFYGLSMSLLYTSMNSVLYISIKSEDIPNASNIGKILQQFSIGLGVVFAVGGFRLLSSCNIELILGNEVSVINAYSIICIILFILMTFNLVIAIPFRIPQTKNFLLEKTPELD